MVHLDWVRFVMALRIAVAFFIPSGLSSNHLITRFNFVCQSCPQRNVPIDHSFIQVQSTSTTSIILNLDPFGIFYAFYIPAAASASVFKSRIMCFS